MHFIFWIDHCAKLSQKLETYSKRLAWYLEIEYNQRMDRCHVQLKVVYIHKSFLKT